MKRLLILVIISTILNVFAQGNGKGAFGGTYWCVEWLCDKSVGRDR